jgi:3-dehydroquinate synthetase
VESLITEVGLPYRLNGIDPEAICAAMATDKKWHGGHSRFILLRGVGLPLIVEDVPMPTVIEALHQLQ